MTRGVVYNQEAFLNKIASRFGRERRMAGVSKPQWKHQPQHRVYQGFSKDKLLEVMKEQCMKIHTEYIETTAENLSVALKTQVKQFSGGPVLIPEDSRFELFGLSDLLNNEWPQQGTEVWEWDYRKGEENIVKAEKANVGITFSEITLAESATIVLYSSKGKGRAVSLLPTTFIAIVPKSTIVPRMTQASQIFDEQAETGKLNPSCINFVTGPSNSADIEMNLVVGVHGPVKAAYLIVTDR
ncbi:lactate utilization protein C [Bacillus gobiensis]|uniref:LutC/YkgG family protein n=1 Tax=Bacillus gobiensis TaxID=1441095 RepID=UPI003D1CFF30